MRSSVTTSESGSGPIGPTVPASAFAFQRPKSIGRRVLTAVALLSVFVACLVGGDLFRSRERLEDAIAPTPKPPPAAPTWESVVTLRGSGSGPAAAFVISDAAIQWRVKWTCQVGRLVVQSDQRARPVVETPCPGTGTGFATDKGLQHLVVVSDGPWQFDVEQELPARAPS